MGSRQVIEVRLLELPEDAMDVFLDDVPGQLRQIADGGHHL